MSADRAAMDVVTVNIQILDRYSCPSIRKDIAIKTYIGRHVNNISMIRGYMLQV